MSENEFPRGQEYYLVLHGGTDGILWGWSKCATKEEAEEHILKYVQRGRPREDVAVFRGKELEIVLKNKLVEVERYAKATIKET